MEPETFGVSSKNFFERIIVNESIVYYAFYVPSSLSWVRRLFCIHLPLLNLRKPMMTEAVQPTGVAHQIPAYPQSAEKTKGRIALDVTSVMLIHTVGAISEQLRSTFW